jgi:hypothetical protein
MHRPDPVVFLYFPTEQSVQLSPTSDDPTLHLQEAKFGLPGGEMEFVGQLRHVDIDEEPSAVEYVPFPQTIHSDAPRALEYVPDPQLLHRADPFDTLNLPGTHAVHMPPSGPEEPALQVHLVKAALPAGVLEFDGQALHVEAPTAVEYVPAPQSVQFPLPAADLYLPDTHVVHVSPFGPAEPELHVQFVKAELPVGELELDGQVLHFEAQNSVEYVPAPQSMHGAVPGNALYIPGIHAVQGPPVGPVEPELQVHLVKAELPVGELDFDGQTMHVEFAEAPSAVEYVPAPQSVH